MQQGTKQSTAAFSLLCLAGGFAIFSSTMSKTPVLPLFAESLGAAPKIVGFIAAAATVVGIITSAPAGFFSDHWGRRKVLLTSGFVFASAPILYYWVKTPWQLAAVRVYHGLATAIFGPVAMALVADMFSTGRAEKMSTYSSATLVGRFLAPLAGGFLIFRFGFRSVYMFCGFFGIVGFFLLWRVPSNERHLSEKKEVTFSFKKMGKEIGYLVRNIPLFVTSLSEAAVYFTFGAVETFFPLYAVKMGIDARQVGLLFSLQILTITFTKPLMGKVSDRYGRKTPIVAGLATAAAAVGCISLFHQAVSLGIVLIFFGLAMATVTASTAALVADLSRQSAYGSSMGFLSSIMDIGHASGPIAAGFFVAAWGYRINFLLVSVIMFSWTLLFPMLVNIPKTGPMVPAD